MARQTAPSRSDPDDKKPKINQSIHRPGYRKSLALMILALDQFLRPCQGCFHIAADIIHPDAIQKTGPGQREQGLRMWAAENEFFSVPIHVFVQQPGAKAKAHG